MDEREKKIFAIALKAFGGGQGDAVATMNIFKERLGSSGMSSYELMTMIESQEFVDGLVEAGTNAHGNLNNKRLQAGEEPFVLNEGVVKQVISQMGMNMPLWGDPE